MTPLPMHPLLLQLLVALLYILMFGGLSFLRREGLSTQFAIESLVASGILIGAGWATGVIMHPIIFLFLLYLITMRSRWAVDLAGLLAQRGHFRPAFWLYRLALAWWPDRAARLLVLANRGAAELRAGRVREAIRTLETSLSPQHRPYLGLRCETACLYNLAVAYDRLGNEAKATYLFNEVIDMLPGSPQGRAAQAALERRRARVMKGSSETGRFDESEPPSS